MDSQRSLGAATATAAVRRALLRSVALFAAGVLLFAAAGLTDSTIEERRAKLLTEGVRVSGVVVAVVDRTRHTAGSIDVRFAVDGQDRVRTLTLLVPDPPIRVDDPITLAYDPADPERLASARAGTDPPLALSAAHLGTTMAAVGLTAAGVILIARWWRRLLATRRHGWRPGTATADAALVHVCLDVAPHSEVRIDTGRSRTHNGRVLLGGAGGAVVLVGADGRVVPGRELARG
ncbi:DUF3592 domain-containing protein [Actinokineospora diospyrosa]|uniref:DUF3592 domain-containing protein n=1 Tax=Actinokineospora diospyrosa TaxID=103728 RepID=A0ABT1I6D9_9PSEU|nr:DUF3592 domain-containing protein [Actinokineospora diospyrosa]MCP2268198.1 hypothetical protein [Actinokineospora diospyrosa]